MIRSLVNYAGIEHFAALTPEKPRVLGLTAKEIVGF